MSKVMMICSDQLFETKKSMNVGKKRAALKWLEIGNEFAKEE
jgi:hypothetical protein